MRVSGSSLFLDDSPILTNTFACDSAGEREAVTLMRGEEVVVGGGGVCTSSLRPFPRSLLRWRWRNSMMLMLMLMMMMMMMMVVVCVECVFGGGKISISSRLRSSGVNPQRHCTKSELMAFLLPQAICAHDDDHVSP